MPTEDVRGEDAVDGSRKKTSGELPLRFRPRNIRFVAYGLATLILCTLAVIAAILPGSWAALDRIALILFGLGLTGGLHLLARPRLDLTEDRVTVVNPVRTHVLAWPEIIDARMPVGEPWPSVDLGDGTTLAVLAIQSNDGAMARENLAQFRHHLRERGEAAEPDRG